MSYEGRDGQFRAELEQLYKEYDERMDSQSADLPKVYKHLFSAVLISTQRVAGYGGKPTKNVVEIASVTALNSVWNDQQRQFLYRQRALGYEFTTSFTALDILLQNAGIQNHAVFSDVSPNEDVRHMVTVKVVHNNYKNCVY